METGEGSGSLGPGSAPTTATVDGTAVVATAVDTAATARDSTAAARDSTTAAAATDATATTTAAAITATATVRRRRRLIRKWGGEAEASATTSSDGGVAQDAAPAFKTGDAGTTAPSGGALLRPRAAPLAGQESAHEDPAAPAPPKASGKRPRIQRPRLGPFCVSSRDQALIARDSLMKGEILKITISSELPISDAVEVVSILSPFCNPLDGPGWMTLCDKIQQQATVASRIDVNTSCLQEMVLRSKELETAISKDASLLLG